MNHLLYIAYGVENCLTSNDISRSAILYDLVLSGASKAKWLGLQINSKVRVFPGGKYFERLKTSILGIKIEWNTLFLLISTALVLKLFENSSTSSFLFLYSSLKKTSLCSKVFLESV